MTTFLSSIGIQSAFQHNRGVMALPPAASPLLQSRSNDLLQVSAPNDLRSLVYRHQPALPKPGFHPLVTPRGHMLTGWEMSDHLWHRGLWFTVKFINNENFWEERAPFGVQASASVPRTEEMSDGSLRMVHNLQWVSSTAGVVLTESRIITMRLADDGVTTLDWDTTLKARPAVILDRTPFHHVGRLRWSRVSRQSRAARG